ncbi:hypothetical protein F5B22DRAFT_589351 [Xylaria bambusicola]|uniref:uncharacterized protein n=1 Tax=Xylaria bambusicola TaxID=326684 RepID=UPI002007439B|nr:uncharacterized protein F5B22DRAFT_589351 [Xylaria bambusicola]KAI0525308.1 hypothetical protein F5B22DRAFT_589351 [Xylaria bambusicola]
MLVILIITSIVSPGSTTAWGSIGLLINRLLSMYNSRCCYHSTHTLAYYRQKFPRISGNLLTALYNRRCLL